MVIDQSRITKANVDNLFKAGKITQAQVDTFNKPIVNPNTVVTPTPSTVVQQPVLDNTNPQYNSLIEKGYTPEQISNAWKGIQEKQNKITPPVKVDTPPTPPVKVDTPVKTDTATTTVKGQPDYQDTSTARQTEILGNLEGFFAANPNSFNNEAEFKKTYSVGTGDRNVKQDQWIMNRYNGKKDAIATNSANQVKLNSLTNLNDASLANISSADAVFLMNNDPTAYLRYQKAKTDKDNLDLINGTPILNKIIEEANANEGPDYEAFINERNAELLPLSTEISGLKTTYENMKNQYDNILADTQKQYQGETSSFVNAMAAKKQREILPQLQEAQTAYNNKATLYNQQKALLDEEFDMQVKQQETERNDLATKLALYEAQYGSFGERLKAAGTTTDKILTQNFGGTKTPNWKQSLDGGKTRQSIEGISGGRTSAGGGTGGGGKGGLRGGTTGGTADAATDIVEGALQDLENASFATRRGAMAGGIGGFLSPDVSKVQSAYDYIINNLSLKTYTDIKKQGATFGAMTEGEWKLIQGASARLRYGLSDKDRATQMGIIRNTFGKAKARAGVKSNTTTNKTSTTQQSAQPTVVPKFNNLSKYSKITKIQPKQQTKTTTTKKTTPIANIGGFGFGGF